MFMDNDHIGTGRAVIDDGHASADDALLPFNNSASKISDFMGKFFSAVFWSVIVIIELVFTVALTAIVFTGIPEKLITEYYMYEHPSYVDDAYDVPEKVYFPFPGEDRFTDPVHIELNSIPMTLPQNGETVHIVNNRFDEYNTHTYEITKGTGENIITTDEFEETTISYFDPDMYYKIEINSPAAADSSDWADPITEKPDLSDPDLWDIFVSSYTREGFNNFARSKGLPDIENYFDLQYTMYNTTPDDWQLLGAEQAKAYLIFLYNKFDTDIPVYYFENDGARGFVDYFDDIEEGYYRCRSIVYVYPNDNRDLAYFFNIKTNDWDTMYCILDGLGRA